MGLFHLFHGYGTYIFFGMVKRGGGRGCSPGRKMVCGRPLGQTVPTNPIIGTLNSSPPPISVKSTPFPLPASPPPPPLHLPPIHHPFNPLVARLARPPHFHSSTQPNSLRHLRQCRGMALASGEGSSSHHTQSHRAFLMIHGGCTLTRPDTRGNIS